MSDVINVTGLQGVLTASGTSDPFSGVDLTQTSGPDTIFTFYAGVSGGTVTPGLTAGSSGVTGVTQFAPGAPDTSNGYYFTGTAAQASAFLQRFSATITGSQMTAELTTFSTDGSGNPTGFGTTDFTVNGVTPGSTEVTNITAACYLRGTMIATPSGEMAIEELRIGDRVTLADGSDAPVKWIATRSYNRGMAEVQPVCIRAGAIADSVPSRDLFVSPQHAMLIDGVLVPAVGLVNGLSIVKCADFSTVDYVHVELASHAAIIANGAPSESYADCENRWMFHNAEEFAALYPNETSATWAFCAPRVEEGAQIEAIQARLAARALTLDSVKTQDHRLFVLADGRAVLPEVGANGRYTFNLASAPSDLRIISRHAVPASLGLSDDTRSVGVSLRTITLRSGGSAIAINAANAALTNGFHAAEGDRRWTSGDAVLPSALLASLTGPVSLEIDAEGLAFYPAKVTALAA